MPKFVLNRKTHQMELAKKVQLSGVELLQLVKRVHAGRINGLNMTDDQLKVAIDKIKSGTRNVSYLVTPETRSPAHMEIFYFLLRESQPK